MDLKDQLKNLFPEHTEIPEAASRRHANFHLDARRSYYL